MSQFTWTKTANPLRLFTDTSFNFLQYILGNWVSVACDASGQTLCAINTYLPLNNIFLSNNYGDNWSNITNSLGNINLSQVAIAPNNQTLCLAAIRNAVYVSKNSGTNWNEYLTDSKVGNCIACNSNGQIILTITSTAKFTPQLTLSVNSGVNFAVVSGIQSHSWISVTMNKSGSYMAACSSDGYCYISTNTGTTWTQICSLPNSAWNSISMDSTGNNIVICSLNGPVYISNNAGSSWSLCSPNNNLNWNNALISRNANIIFLTANNSNSIYYSTNNGVSWTTTNPDLNFTNWGSICCNNNGSIVYACVNGGYIYSGILS